MTDDTPPLQITGRAGVIDQWSPQVAAALAKSAVTELRVRDGWEEPSLTPLAAFRDQVVVLRVECDISDLSALGEFSKLEELSVRRGLGTIDFSRLQRLKTVAVSDDAPMFGNLHESRSLEELSIVDCGLRDLVPLAKFSHLTKLTVGEAPLRTLAGIGNLRSLRRLALGQVPLESLGDIGQASTLEEVVLHLITRLSSVAELTKLPTLKRLDIRSARKVADWERVGELDALEELTLASVSPPSLAFLSRLKRLRSLYLQGSGKIPSLSIIRGLNKLEKVVLLEGTTVVDGDMSVLLELPLLREVLYDERRRYSPRREDIESALKARRSDG